jgi:hypothetical protein
LVFVASKPLGHLRDLLLLLFDESAKARSYARAMKTSRRGREKMFGRKFAIAAAVLAALAVSVAAPTASAEVNYSPLYWEMLDRYASAELPVEYTGAPYRGVYYGNPAAPWVCEEVCGEMIALYILNPTAASARMASGSRIQPPRTAGGA